MAWGCISTPFQHTHSMEDYMKFIEAQALNYRNILSKEEQEKRAQDSRRSNAQELIDNDRIGQPFRGNRVRLDGLLSDYKPN